MNDVDLKEAIRHAARPPAGAPDLAAVRKRARTLRRRRVVGTAALAAIGVAAIAWPLQQLGHVGEGSIPAADTGSPISFAPLDGWHTITGDATGNTSQVEASSALIANVPLPNGSDAYPLGIDNGVLDRLPPSGIAISAQQLLQTRNPIPTRAGYPQATLPLDLTDGRSSTGGMEGVARTDLTHISLTALVQGRPIIVSAWLGTDNPDHALLQETQRALDQLNVVPADTTTDAIDQFGIAMPVPQGWHALLYGGDPTLIVSTRPIDTLYWDVTRREMGATDVTMILDESDALVELQGWAPLEGPLSIGQAERCDGCEALDDGSPPTPGHALYQRTFTTGGRAFSLYVEFGSQPSSAQIDAVNGLLAGLTIQPISNPTYTPAPGTTRVGPIYDGEDTPEVRANDANRMLGWTYARVGLRVPAGWTGQTYPVAGLERPASLLAAGSWDFTPGGYCGPVNAIRALPDDGAFVWVDGYGDRPPQDQVFVSQPASVDLSTAPSDPSPCFAGSSPYVFRWLIDGRAFVVHVLLGPGASPATVRAATEAIMSIGP